MIDLKTFRYLLDHKNSDFTQEQILTISLELFDPSKILDFNYILDQYISFKQFTREQLLSFYEAHREVFAKSSLLQKGFKEHKEIKSIIQIIEDNKHDSIIDLLKEFLQLSKEHIPLEEERKNDLNLFYFGKAQKLLKLQGQHLVISQGVPSGEGCRKVLIFPAIPKNGSHSCTFKLLSDSNKCIYIGLKDKECEKTEDQWLGHLDTEWSLNIERATRHHMRTENRYGRPLKKNETITITLNRDKGTLSYKIGKTHYDTAFTDDAFKTSTLYFAVSMYVKD